MLTVIIRSVEKMKKDIKIVMARHLSIIMVAMMILTGFSFSEFTYATDSAPGGTIASNNNTAAINAFGSGNVTVSDYSNKTLTITLNNDITLNSPIRIVKGASGDKVIINLNGHTITGKAGINPSTDWEAACGGNAIEIVASDFDVEITGNGTVEGGSGAKYETSDHMYYGGSGGMAIAYVNSTWKPTADNGKLTHGLTVSGGSTIKGGDGAVMTGEDWLYNIVHYDGDKRGSYSSYDDIMFSLRGGHGGDAIGQTGNNVAEGLSDVAYAAITIENASVMGGSGGIINLNTSHMPILTNYGLLKNEVINDFLDEIRKTASFNDQYSNYVTNQIKFQPGNGGDGIVIGDGRKYVKIAETGSVEGGPSGNFDYGRSKLVNQFDSIGAGRVAKAGNGIGIYGDIGLTNISPTDSSVNANNASSKTADSNEMGIYIAGTVKGGSSPDAVAMNEYSGDAGSGIAIDGYYGRYNWGIIEVASEGSVIGGASGNAAYGSVGSAGAGIIELTGKGKDAFETPYGTDYHIINGTVTGGKGGDSLGFTSAGSGAYGMSFDRYRKGVRVYGGGSITGGDCGDEINHNQAESSYRSDAVYIGSDSSNRVTVEQKKGKKTTITDADKLDIEVTMSNFDSNPTSSTGLSLSGIPQGYSGNVYITWSATIYETSSVGSATYDIESAGTNLVSFNMLSNELYGGYLAYPTYPTHSSIQLNMNNYNADVATTDRMSEDGKYQTDIYCSVVLEDGRWGKSNIMRYEKNRGWDGSGNVTEEESSGGDDTSIEEMEEALAVGTAIKALPAPENVTNAHNSTIYDVKAKYNSLSDEQKEKYLFDYDYEAKLAACEAALEAIVGNGDAALIELINERLDEITDTDSLSLDDEANIKAIQAAYNNLSEAAKAEFDNTANKEKLVAAVNRIDELRTEADAEGCTHYYLEKVSAKAATCHSEGNISYYKCIGCGTYFSDQDGKNEITNKDSVKVSMDGYSHEYGDWAIVKKPTCSSKGEKRRTCKYHSNVWQAEDIPTEPNAHKWSEWTFTTAPTCVSGGVSTRTCLECGKTETQKYGIDKNAHTWKKGKTITTFYTDYYKTSKTDICTSCGKKNVVNNTIYYKKNLPKVKIAKGKAAKKKFTAKWKKVSGKNKKKIGGIEIQVQGPGLNKVYSAGKGKTSKVIKVPKAKKKYKYRVRAYKGSGTGKQVSAWSGWESVKVK